jgi:hypothetical protein
LIALGFVGGVVPTGLAGVPYAALVLACTFGALLVLLAACVIGAVLAQPSQRATPVPQLALRRTASTGSASRTI